MYGRPCIDHQCRNSSQDKFTTAEDETNNTSADPGMGLAWLVVIQVLVYYLCSSIISTATYFGIFVFIYVKWVYPLSNSIESKPLEECVSEADTEPEWILDQFLSYIQQNKAGGIFSFSDLSHGLVFPKNCLNQRPQCLIRRSQSGWLTSFSPMFNNPVVTLLFTYHIITRNYLQDVDASQNNSNEVESDRR